MQLPRGRRRQIPQSSRPEGPLAYARLSDPILVKRAKDGDASALEALCERHAPRVEKLAGHLLRDPEDAHDAAQEALAKLISAVAGMPVGTAKCYAHRGRSRLRDKLSDVA
jgi:DNA-directed RNA polymerase specialized sigma24 family protein